MIAAWNFPLFTSASWVERIAPRGVTLMPNLFSASVAWFAALVQSEKSLGN